MVKRKLISTGSTFEENIGYSRAVVHGDWIFVSGTTGYDYTTMKISDDIVEQAEQCMTNIVETLSKANAKLSDVVRVTYILPDASQFDLCHPTLKKYFGLIKPAATMLSAGLANDQMLIEIEVTAIKS